MTNAMKLIVYIMPLILMAGCVKSLKAPLAASEEPKNLSDGWQAAPGPIATRWAKDVSPRNALVEYPRPQMVRSSWANLNGLWDYAITAREAASVENWQGKILVPFPVESSLSGVGKKVDEKQKLWYHTKWDGARALAGDGKRVLLNFGASDWQTTVWVNGKEIGKHQGGFDPFSFDITDALKSDAATDIVVSVYDPTDQGTQPRGKQVLKPGGIFYTPTTGIWQTVWVEAVPTKYIKGLKITPRFDAGEVEVQANIVGGSNVPDGDFFQFDVFDGDKRVGGAGGPSGIVRIKIADMKAWTPDSPFLYKLKVKCDRDEVESYFGMRKIEVKKDDKGVNRIYLNNQPIFMAGPLDQGYWPDGLLTAPTDEALKYDIEITKKLGFNCTRKHVKVEPERWYYWCDKLGLIVWQDMPAGDNQNVKGKSAAPDAAQSAKNFESELKAMIDARYNHPCIVMWVVFNEGWGQYDTQRVVSWTKQYDPSRLINPASGWTDFPVGDLIDMHNYPGPGAPKLQENRAAVLGEFGGLGLATKGHMWEDKNWGYKGVADGAALTKAYGKLLSKSYALRESAGLNAVIYTQLTDVETEANGLLSYDREVIKVDVDEVAKANQGNLPPTPAPRELAASSEKAPQQWRYTTDKPDGEWFKPGFDAGKWKEGPGGFGTAGTPGAVIGTEWKTSDIWMRREFTLGKVAVNEPYLSVHHDDDVEIYVNGVLAAKMNGYTSSYEEFELSKEAKATLAPGKNTIAVHCHQNNGGQFIDVGILDAK